MTRRLRIAHVIVQPVLVWDDGDELAPGPTAPAATLRLSEVPRMIASLPGDVDALSEQILAAEAAVEAAADDAT